ncbi:DNA-binding NtrC family response regulator [Neobacillus niacini]|uniref:hypothetical protein n=1 Tax=Neobacillus niacini TaxID=86668 RepID=UPI00278402F5|nr:hypothetical protein [Neobacillus niacini]MDQ1005148.1 DNA-binding NtrC family response regulator [Neobacillus niacini]
MYGHKYNKFKTFDQEVIHIFTDYEWKGNVRELQNTIERLVLTVQAQHIDLGHLPENLTKAIFSS